MNKQSPFLLRTTRQLNGGAIVTGLGFLLYLGASGMGWLAAADALAALFALLGLYVLASAAALRRKDKEAVSYSLLWGLGALTILLAACALLALKSRL